MGISCVNSTTAGDIVCATANSETGAACMLRLSDRATAADPHLLLTGTDARAVAWRTPLTSWNSNPHGTLLTRAAESAPSSDADADALRVVVAVPNLGLVVELATAEVAGGGFQVPPPASGADAPATGDSNATHVLAAFEGKAFPYYFAPPPRTPRAGAARAAVTVSLEGNGTIARVGADGATRKLAHGGSVLMPHGLTRAADGGCVLFVANHTEIWELCGDDADDDADGSGATAAVATTTTLARLAKLPRYVGSGATAACGHDFHQIARVPAAPGDAEAFAILDADNGAVFLWRRDAPHALDFVAGNISAAGFCDGVGEGARFHAPHALAPLDGTSLVVADTGNGALRRVVVVGAGFGTVTTIAVFGANDTCGASVATGTAYSFGNCSECACSAVAAAAADDDNDDDDARRGGAETELDGAARATAASTTAAGPAGRLWVAAGAAVLAGLATSWRRAPTRGYRAILEGPREGRG